LEPEMQHKIREEINQVLPHEHDIPDLDMRDKCPFTSAFIFEVLRFRPLLPFSLPHKAVEETDILGYKIPAGTTILPSLIDNLEEEEAWPEPNKFIPERFLDEETGKSSRRPNPHFVPFSTGRRSCIGEKLAQANLFLILSRLIQKTKGFSFQVDMKPGDTRETLLYGDICKTDFVGPVSYKLRLVPDK